MGPLQGKEQNVSGTLMSLCVPFSEQQPQVSWNEFVHFPWKWTLSYHHLVKTRSWPNSKSALGSYNC